MVRLRTILEAHNQLKIDDPDTALTLCALRRMVKSGDFPSVSAGRKSLVDYDQLIHYLHAGVTNPAAYEPKNVGEIRKISIN